MAFLFNLVVSLAVGGVCGCIAGKIMDSEGSMTRNVILGIVGGIVGGLIVGLLGFSVSNIVGSIISGVLGSCLIIWVAKKFF